MSASWRSATGARGEARPGDLPVEDRQCRTHDPRGSGRGNAEEFLWYPPPNIRVTRTRDAAGTVIRKVGTLHLDGLGSVRAVTDEAGLARERTAFRPYGEEMAALTPLTLPESAPARRHRSEPAGARLHRRTLRRRFGAPVPQRPILRPQARHVHPARLVGGDKRRRRNE